MGNLISRSTRIAMYTYNQNNFLIIKINILFRYSANPKSGLCEKSTMFYQT